MKLTAIIFSIILCLGCNSNKANHSDVKTTNDAPIKEKEVEKAFDSKMNVLLNKYDFAIRYRSVDSTPLHNLYHLVKRIYVPAYHNFTFDLRKLNQNSSDIATVVHIYNDSIDYIIPFIDLQYYYWRSNKEDEVKNEGPLTFEPELNNAIAALNLKEYGEMEMFLYYLMSFFYKMDRIAEPIELEKYNLINEYYINKVDHRESCEIELKRNSKFVKNHYKIKNSFTYSNGIVVFYFEVNESGHITTQILNYSCAIPLFL